jgi:hypothetical protein
LSRLQALVEKAKSIERIDEESVVAITTSLEKAIDIAKERAAYFEYIPSLKEHYSTNCFDSTTEGQMCDLV